MTEDQLEIQLQSLQVWQKLTLYLALAQLDVDVDNVSPYLAAYYTPKAFSRMYSETPPYDHPENRTTPKLRPHFG